MTTIKIDIPDKQAAALTAKATAQGLSLEALFLKMLAEQAPAAEKRYSLTELVAQCDLQDSLSEEDREWLEAPATGREVL